MANGSATELTKKRLLLRSRETGVSICPPKPGPMKYLIPFIALVLLAPVSADPVVETMKGRWTLSSSDSEAPKKLDIRVDSSTFKFTTRGKRRHEVTASRKGSSFQTGSIVVKDYSESESEDFVQVWVETRPSAPEFSTDDYSPYETTYSFSYNKNKETLRLESKTTLRNRVRDKKYVTNYKGEFKKL